MVAVRAMLFDTFGTVVDWRGGLIAHLQTWGAARGVTADWAGLVDAWRFAYMPSMETVRAGHRGWADLDDLQRESVAELAPRFGITGLHGDALEELVRMWHDLPPWPDSVEGLQRLRLAGTAAGAGTRRLRGQGPESSASSSCASSPNGCRPESVRF